MTVPLFVELCAGTAALSLRLHARGARPPVSRMGAKTGYADAILRVLGLAPGARAAHYLWCEPDPGVRLLLEAYRDADLARAAAAIIRGWADEEPRALWERLRAEGPPVLPATGAEVARWVVTGQWAYRPGQPESGFAACRAYERIGPDGYPRMDFDIPTVTARFDAAPTLPATIAPDARTVDPREVARWAITNAWSMRPGQARAGFRDPHGGFSGKGPTDTVTLAGMVRRLDTAPDPPRDHPPRRPRRTPARAPAGDDCLRGPSVLRHCADDTAGACGTVPAAWHLRA